MDPHDFSAIANPNNPASQADYENQDPDEPIEHAAALPPTFVADDLEDSEVVGYFISDDVTAQSRILSAPMRIPLVRTLTSTSSWSTMLDHTRGYEYSLLQWCRMIQGSPSLASAEIVKADRYYQKTIVPHRFIVLQLRRKNRPKDIFVRLDRRPKAGINPLRFVMTSGITTANDCAFLAADENRAVRGNTPIGVSMSLETSIIFPDPLLTPTLLHLEQILDSIGRNMKKYKLSSENCWFFCAICLESLSNMFKAAVVIGELRHTGLPAAPELRARIYAQIPHPQAKPSPTPPPLQPSPPPARSPLPSPNSPSPEGKPKPSLTSVPPPPVFLLSASGSSQPLPFSPSPSPHSPPLHLLSPSSQPHGSRQLSAPEPHIPSWSKSHSHASLPPSQTSAHLLTKITVGTIIYIIAVHPNGNSVASHSHLFAAQLWDATTGAAIGERLDEGTGIFSLALSPNGRHIALGNGEHHELIHVRDATTGDFIGEPLNHTAPIESFAFSPDGLRIASGTADSIRLWDALTGAAIGDLLRGHTGTIKAITFSLDGLCIASTTESERTLIVRLWNFTTGVVSDKSLTGHTGWITSVAFSPNRRFVATGAEDNTIRHWDAVTGNLIGEPLKGHSDSVTSVAFSSDGQRIASGSRDTTIRIWDAVAGRVVGEPLRGHKYTVASVAFFPDGRVVSGSFDKTICVWDVSV